MVVVVAVVVLVVVVVVGALFVNEQATHILPTAALEAHISGPMPRTFGP